MSTVIAVSVISVGLLVAAFTIILLKQRERINELEVRLARKQEHKKVARVAKAVPAPFRPTQMQIELLKDALKDVRFRAILWNIFKDDLYLFVPGRIDIQHFLEEHGLIKVYKDSDSAINRFLSVLRDIGFMKSNHDINMSRKAFEAAYGSVVDIDDLNSWMLSSNSKTKEARAE